MSAWKCPFHGEVEPGEEEEASYTVKVCPECGGRCHTPA